MQDCIGCGRASENQWCHDCINKLKSEKGLNFIGLLNDREIGSLYRVCNPPIEKNNTMTVEEEVSAHDKILTDLNARHEEAETFESGARHSEMGNNISTDKASGSSDTVHEMGEVSTYERTAQSRNANRKTEEEPASGGNKFVIRLLMLLLFAVGSLSFLKFSWHPIPEWIFALGFGVAIIVSGIYYSNECEHNRANISNTVYCAILGLFAWIIGPSYSLVAGIIYTAIAINTAEIVLSAIDFDEIFQAVWSGLLLALSIVLVVKFLPWSIAQWCIFAVLLSVMLVVTFTADELWANITTLLLIVFNVVALVLLPYDYSRIATVSSFFLILSSAISAILSADENEKGLSIAYICYAISSIIISIVLL